MENCFIKKLNVSVDSDNRYNNAVEITIGFNMAGAPSHIVLTDSYKFNFGGVGCIIRPISNCHVTDNKGNNIEMDGEYKQTGYSSITWISPVSTASPAKFLIIGLSKITQLFGLDEGRSFRFMDKKYHEVVKYLTNLDSVTSIDFYGLPDLNKYCDISYLKDMPNKSTVTSIWFYVNSKKNVDLSVFAEFPNLTNITNLLRSAFIYGNLADIGHVIELTELNFLSTSEVTGDIKDIAGLTALTTLYTYKQQITGSIEEYVALRSAASVAAGGSAGGSLSLKTNGIITWQGTPLVAGYIKTITWSGSNPEDITIS